MIELPTSYDRRGSAFVIRVFPPPSGFLIFESETVDVRIVIHGINAPVCHRQSAEVRPSRDRTSATVKLLAGARIYCVENRVEGVLLSLGVRQQGIAWVNDRPTISGDLVWILAC